MAYYLNAGMLAKQYETIAAYPDAIRSGSLAIFAAIRHT
jgi:hypothetical protein